jgi:hypothetical protein
MGKLRRYLIREFHLMDISRWKDEGVLDFTAAKLSGRILHAAKLARKEPAAGGVNRHPIAPTEWETQEFIPNNVGFAMRTSAELEEDPEMETGTELEEDPEMETEGALEEAPPDAEGDAEVLSETRDTPPEFAEDLEESKED